MTDRDLHVAVFGDVHGHLRLMFQLARIWQVRNGVHLDLILQCGDLGFFPDPAKLDNATQRFAADDIEELGFGLYFAQPQPPESDVLLEAILNGDSDSLQVVRCPVIWCHGNHEDLAALEQLSGGRDLTPVDVFGTLCFLRDGCVTEWEGLRIAAVGGAPEREDPAARDPRHATRHPWRQVNPRACDQLAGQAFDVLLSHGGPADVAPVIGGAGSPALRALVDLNQPAYHVYAHHSKAIPPVTLGATRCVWMADVNFSSDSRERARVNEGCMGILRWRDRASHDFALVGPDTWGGLTPTNWTRAIP